MYVIDRKMYRWSFRTFSQSLFILIRSLSAEEIPQQVVIKHVSLFHIIALNDILHHML